MRGRRIPDQRESLQDRAAEFDDPLQEFLAALAHHNLFSSHERDQSVRGLLHEFDEIGIYGERLIVQTRKPDHVCVPAGLFTAHGPTGNIGETKAGFMAGG
jgi:hypothetical protein